MKKLPIAAENRFRPFSARARARTSLAQARGTDTPRADRAQGDALRAVLRSEQWKELPVQLEQMPGDDVVRKEIGQHTERKHPVVRQEAHLRRAPEQRAVCTLVLHDADVVHALEYRLLVGEMALYVAHEQNERALDFLLARAAARRRVDETGISR